MQIKCNSAEIVAFIVNNIHPSAMNGEEEVHTNTSVIF